MKKTDRDEGWKSKARINLVDQRQKKKTRKKKTVGRAGSEAEDRGKAGNRLAAEKEKVKEIRDKKILRMQVLTKTSGEIKQVTT